MIAVMRSWLLMALLIPLGCARRTDTVTRAPDTLFRTMPNPDGCYLQVWDGPAYTGQFDYINGPQAYTTLRDLPNQRNWDRRIASLRIGPAASAAAFTEEVFRGPSVEFLPGTDLRTLPENLNRRIASLRVQCLGASNAR